MVSILKKLSQKTTWLGIIVAVVPILRAFGVEFPDGADLILAQILSGVAALVLILVNPR